MGSPPPPFAEAISRFNAVRRGAWLPNVALRTAPTRTGCITKERYTTRMRPFGQARANGASVEVDLPNRVVDVNVDHSVWRDVLNADDAVLVLIHDVHT